MAWLGDLLIRLRADTADFQSDMGKTVVVTERAFSRINRAAGALGVGLSAGGLVLLVKSAIDAGDELSKLSSKVGVSVESLSKLKLAAELGDVSFDGLAKGMREFNRSMVEGADASSKSGRLFKALGVDITAGPERAFRQFADAFSKLPEGELRMAVAMEVLKKSGADWIPVLEKGTKGLDEAAEKAERLGLVMTGEFAKQAEQFNDNLKLLKKSADALALSLSKNMIEGLNHVVEKLVEAKEKGHLFGQTFLEIAKFTAVLASTLPKWMGLSQLGTAAADFLFQQEERNRNLRSGPKNLWPGPNTPRFMPGDPRRAATPAAAAAAAPDPAKVLAALSQTEQLTKRQNAALQQMEERKKSIFNLNEQEIMIQRITTGSYKDFNAEVKVKLLNLALEIDLESEKKQRIEAGLPALQAEADAYERAGEIFRDYAQATRDAAGQRAFDIEMVGKSAREQEKANAVRQIDLDLQRRLYDLARAAGEDLGLYLRESAKLEAQAAIQRANATSGIDARIAKEREWSTGARTAMQNYIEQATNAAANAEMLFTNAFRGMEDALVNFVKTGKLDFKSLADSIITDLIRIQIREQMVNVLGGGGGGGLLAKGLSFLRGGSASAGSMAGASDVGSVSTVGMAADGGSITMGKPFLVGERGPELFVPNISGNVIPNDELGGGDGPTVFIDARGADSAAIARLEQKVNAMQGKFERRAVGAQIDAARRGVRA